MKQLGLYAVLFGTLSVSTALANPLSLNFSSLPGSEIQFNGTSSTFNINDNGAGEQWWITGVTGGAGDSLTLKGQFSGGPWSYGSITTSGSDQSATVIGPLGSFTLYDGMGGSAIGNVNWVELATHSSAGGVNTSASVNISGMSYFHGSTLISDLQNLVAEGSGSVLLTFQFSPGMTLNDLTTGTGPYKTSYSGSLSPSVPDLSTPMLSLAVLLPLVARGLRTLNREP